MRAKDWPICAIILVTCVARGQSPPRLSPARLADQRVQLTWPAGGTFKLEEATSLSPLVIWRTVNAQPVKQGNQLTLILQATDAQRYFRLASGAPEPLTVITATSPSAGEPGVSVTRETVVYFSNPLASETKLDAAQFYATFAERRLLGRVESFWGSIRKIRTRMATGFWTARKMPMTMVCAPRGNWLLGWTRERKTQTKMAPPTLRKISIVTG